MRLTTGNMVGGSISMLLVVTIYNRFQNKHNIERLQQVRKADEAASLKRMERLAAEAELYGSHEKSK